MSSSIFIQQAKAQAIYMEELLKLAQKQAKEEKPLNFGPQGRILLNITPDDEQIKDIVEKINTDLHNNFVTNKDNLDKALGRKNTPTTIVSLDITKDGGLNGLFLRQIAEELKKNLSEKESNAIKECLEKIPKGSIIELQQEFNMHLALSERLYTKCHGDIAKDKLAKVHKDTMTEVNALVMAQYADALKEAYKSGAVDISRLNKYLDKARKKITPKAHSILAKNMAKIGVVLTKENTKNLKHEAEMTTASPYDVLHTNPEGLITLIEGSEETAHNRKKGEEFAHRQIITCNLADDGKVSIQDKPRIQIRTPSPVVKKRLHEKEYIADVAIKLKQIKDKYHLVERLGLEQIDGFEQIDEVENRNYIPRAFIYNSYTALNDYLGDINGNLQTQSARHILLGAHAYNKQELMSSKPVYCFVQNISVNGFGDTLGYDNKDPLIKESTLMAEMALIHTLYDTETLEEKNKISTIFDNYNKYLNELDESKPILFSESKYGKKSITAINDLKETWKKIKTNKDKTPDPILSAKLALRKLMSDNLHCDHKYAKLFQSLSVFVGESSIGGCKSGNERAQAINGRVAVFDKSLQLELPISSFFVGDSIDGNKISNGRAQEINGRADVLDKSLQLKLPDITEAIKNLAHSHPNNIKNYADKLKTAVDTEYNKTGLQGANSIISLLDQGGAAKVLAKARSFFERFNRNHAEESSEVMSNLSQSKAGKMQAHKDLSNQILHASGIRQTFMERMGSFPFSAKVAILFTFPISVPYLFRKWAIDDRKKAKNAEELSRIEPLQGGGSEVLMESNLALNKNNDHKEITHDSNEDYLRSIPISKTSSSHENTAANKEQGEAMLHRIRTDELTKKLQDELRSKRETQGKKPVEEIKPEEKNDDLNPTNS